MDVYHTLTVKEILERPLFRKAKVVAGHEGLNRVVKWVHVFEVTEIGELLHGHELILSTGIVWGQKHLRLSFLQQLIEKNVSALCIQLGYYFEKIPDDLIQMADRHHFPVIVWEKADEIPYVDITQDLHRALINKHYEMVDQLERFSNEVNQLLLSANALPKILHRLHRFLNVQVAYLPLQGEALCIPNPGAEERREKILSLVRSGELARSGLCVAVKPVQAFNQKWADLALISRNRELTEFDSLILDRCATAVAQELMRTLYVEERRRHQEDQWIYDWLSGKHQDEEVFRRLKTIDPAFKTFAFKTFKGCVCVAGIEKQQSFDRTFNESQILHLAVIARSIFQQYGFITLSTMREPFLIFILVDTRDGQAWKTRVTEALERIKGSAVSDKVGFTELKLGVGKMVDDVTHISKSFQMAQKVLEIEEKAGKKNRLFYEDLHIYRLFDAVSDEELKEFVMDYLKPVIDYDRQRNGELMQTLYTYLACHGSKRETAEKLFVVRQTLYHRIQKLEELLGSDFMSPEKRLAIEFAVHAYHYLYKSKN
ncbi:MAG: hypothetical protein BAA01_14400 [Bacillus thermozeamaize]|uniref:PucR family transcriptional regulator n=1 Tax=Bacillus thermozeamaize TaxID=230954 RepID=A0A1Y3PRR0_9BACI|nr:MAG: hypothetical protein BAA01_14400 [Bacillus thermozeamaize]